MSFSLTFSVATNEPEVLAANFMASPCLANAQEAQVLLQRGFTSAAGAHNDAIDRSQNDVIVFAHQDVYFPAGWSQQLRRALDFLEESDPNWGVLGCWGVTRDGRYHGYVCSSTMGVHGVPFEKPAVIQTLDEIVLIIRRSSGLRFDETLGHFHLYGTDLCLEAAKKGLRSYAIYAPCVHNTRQGPVLPAEFYQGCEYIRKKWRHLLPIQTTCIRLTQSNYEVYRRRLHDIYLRWTTKSLMGVSRYKDVNAMVEDLTTHCMDQQT